MSLWGYFPEALAAAPFDQATGVILEQQYLEGFGPAIQAGGATRGPDSGGPSALSELAAAGIRTPNGAYNFGVLSRQAWINADGFAREYGGDASQYVPGLNELAYYAETGILQSHASGALQALAGIPLSAIRTTHESTSIAPIPGVQIIEGPAFPSEVPTDLTSTVFEYSPVATNTNPQGQPGPTAITVPANLPGPSTSGPPSAFGYSAPAGSMRTPFPVAVNGERSRSIPWLMIVVVGAAIYFLTRK
jgi:hypothetical protein